MKNILTTALGLYDKVQTALKYGVALADTFKYAVDRFSNIEKVAVNDAD